jgi:uncharacterized protein YjlB
MMAGVTSPQTMIFSDDGSIPNNPRLPFVLYRNAIDLAGTPDPEDVIEAHYHSMIHEVLGVARGRARVRFGGAGGQEIELGPGDVVVLPAGTGHQGLWAAPELMVIGAYPKSGKYDLCRGSKAEHARALETILHVPLPNTDPVHGADGPLRSLWR